MSGRNPRWRDRSDEERNRCRATERRGRQVVQCTEDRRDADHQHRWRGIPFGPGFRAPVGGSPTLSPGWINLK